MGRLKETGDAGGGAERVGLGERLGNLLSILWQGRGPRAVQLQLVSRMALGPKQSLALVEADGMRILIATASNSAATMLLLPKAEQAGAEMTMHAYENGHAAHRLAENQDGRVPIRRMPGRAS